MRYLLLSAALLLSLFSPAQNLVVNPGFEEWKTPDLGYCTMKNDEVKGWYDVGQYSSDLYRPSIGNYDNSASIGGTMKPHSGLAFGGFLGHYSNNYREYSGGSLSAPMQAGVTYSIRFFLALGPGCSFGVNETHLYFTSQLSPDNKGDDRFNAHHELTPQVTIGNLDYVHYSGQWKEVTAEYRAKGGEQFFVVGNFNDDSHSKVMRPLTGVGPLSWCYYYIDDFTIVRKGEPIVEEIIPSPVLMDTSITAGKVMTSRATFFAKGKSELNDDAESTLYLVAFAMKKQQDLSVEIDWYADEEGTPESTQQLAQTRAQAIADYLVKKGIAKERITTKGFASDKTGKAKDHRVEFVFTQ